MTLDPNSMNPKSAKQDFDWFIKADWPAPIAIKAGVTTRNGPGLSQAPFHRFNLGENSGDLREAVVMNRQILRERLHLPSEPVWLRQEHGTQVNIAKFKSISNGKDVDTWLGENKAINSPACEVLDERQRARDAAGCTPVHLYSPSVDPLADASYTDEANVVLAVLSADCLPILMCNKSGTELAAVHAGWRGLAAGVIENTLSKFKSARDDILIWLGPAAGSTDYEVGLEVRDAFVKRHAFANSQFTPTRDNHWHCDLYGLAKQRLQISGVHAIYGGGLSTISDQTRFYSHRRDQRSGRMASLIWLQNN